MRPGPLNLITDLAGFTVGNATDEAAATGVTTLFCDGLWTAAADVRGGGPGVRETDTLSPENLVGAAHAIVLTGGSVFGLAAADGVAAGLSAHNTGLRLQSHTPAIPIVPAAVLHDLANEGDKAWGLDPPYRRLGLETIQDAEVRFALGSVGAGRGAQAGLLKGGLGSASTDLGDGLMVGALVAVNPAGSVYMPDGETFWAWPFELDEEFGGRSPQGRMLAPAPIPDDSKLARMGRLQAGANTTIAVVAVNADLTGVECKRVAIMAQDGLARAIRPAHTPFDGDTVFSVASGEVGLGNGSARHLAVARLGSTAADCLARAIARGVYEAGKG